MSTKIYLVICFCGDCDTSYEWIHKAFFSEEQANIEKDIYNKNLVDKKKQSLLCDNCPANYFTKGTNISNELSQDRFIKNITKKCDNAEISFDEDGDVSCKNRIDFYDYNELYSADIKELEVIE